MSKKNPAPKTMSLKTNRSQDLNLYDRIDRYFSDSPGSFAEKIAAFPKFVPRQRLTDFLSLYEIFKLVLPVQGSIIDCGVYLGRTLMTFAQLSAILEPMNYQRRIIGFDTFEGFLQLSPQDAAGTHKEKRIGGYKAESYEDLTRAIQLFDSNRFINHIPKVELIKGDIVKTAAKYIKSNPHLIVSLLSLDLSLYKPTCAALRTFVPRMPKGAVIVFAEMNCSDFSGEVLAVLDELGIRNLRIRRNLFDTVTSYTVLE